MELETTTKKGRLSTKKKKKRYIHEFNKNMHNHKKKNATLVRYKERRKMKNKSCVLSIFILLSSLGLALN